jgi:hypothetical protein
MSFLTDAGSPENPHSSPYSIFPETAGMFIVFPGAAAAVAQSKRIDEFEYSSLRHFLLKNSIPCAVNGTTEAVIAACAADTNQQSAQFSI